MFTLRNVVPFIKIDSDNYLLEKKRIQITLTFPLFLFLTEMSRASHQQSEKITVTQNMFTSSIVYVKTWQLYSSPFRSYEAQSVDIIVDALSRS